MAMSDTEEDVDPVMACTPSGLPGERPTCESPEGTLQDDRNAQAWIEMAPPPPIGDARGTPREVRRLGPAIDLMYAEVAARCRSQLANRKGKKRMAEGPQRVRAAADELGTCEMPIRVSDPPAQQSRRMTGGGHGRCGVHAGEDQDEIRPQSSCGPRGAGPREATLGGQATLEERLGMGMPWASCEMHRETIQDEVKRLWDRLQYLADNVADLREENTRKENAESVKDQRPEGRGQREATGTNGDSLMERMARLEWMMERVLHACSAIDEKIGQRPG